MSAHHVTVVSHVQQAGEAVSAGCVSSEDVGESVEQISVPVS